MTNSHTLFLPQSIEMVVAASLNGVIGHEGRLPWKLSDDMGFFKELTSGHIVVMGSKTFASLPKPLKNRTSIVLSNRLCSLPDPSFDVHMVRDIDHAIERIDAIQEEGVSPRRVFVIGGESVYNEWLPLVSNIHLTLVLAYVAGDKFFHYERLHPSEWFSEPPVFHDMVTADMRNKHSHVHLKLIRRKLVTKFVSFS